MTDLGFSLSAPPRTRGRAAKPLHAEYIRDLSEADIASLSLEGRETGKSVPIKELRERHHQVARLLALGNKPGEVSAMTGMSPSRISVLQADPTFKELVEFYSGQETQAMADMRAQMTTMSLDALQELMSRLEDKPDEFSESLLLEISTRFADRVGFSPKSASGGGGNEVHIHIGERMAKAKERLQAIRAIDITPGDSSE